MHFSKVLLRPVPSVPALAHLPNVIAEEVDETTKEEQKQEEAKEQDQMQMVSSETASFPEVQLQQGLVTMSKGSVQWQVNSFSARTSWIPIHPLTICRDHNFS